MYAMILAGGIGERLWPYSRKDRPKHLMPLIGDRTMIQMTVDRLEGLVEQSNIFIITNKDQKEMIQRQLPGLDPDHIIAEPFGRNTAAAVALGAVYIQNKDPESVMMVLSSDHLIKEIEIFQRTLSDCAEAALRDGCLAIMGVPPTYPNTGYGYIKIGNGIDDDAITKIYQVESFKEKPGPETAEQYFQSGEYFWNTGMFIWKTSTIMDEFKQHMPDLYDGCAKIQASIGTDREEAVIEEVYSGLEKVPIDIGIMEKAENVVVARAEFDWDDIGSWKSMENHVQTDQEGNASNCDFDHVDSKGLIVMAEEGFVGTVGVEDLIIVRSGDAVMVCHKDRAQDVKTLLGKMGKDNFLEYL